MENGTLTRAMALAAAACMVVGAMWCAKGAAAETYYVANDGSDDGDGQSPATAWQTLTQVNGAELEAGDQVLFRRGDEWRGQLRACSGDESGHVTYGAYGSGAKPLLLGSIEKNRREDWVDEGGNVWATAEVAPTGRQVLPNPSFSEDASGWNLHYEGGASASGWRDTTDYDSEPAGYRVKCAGSGENGSHIQLYTSPFHIDVGTLYRLEFRAMAGAPFSVSMPHLMKSGPPWTSYAAGTPLPQRAIQTSWQGYVHFYQAGVTADDARLTFFLGGRLPAGATFHLDSLGFTECVGQGALPCDVGNIIFDGEASCGVKVWNESDLDAQGEYWYDEDRHVLKLYSEACPAEQYSDIECALRAHIISQSNARYVTYENLSLKYGAAHGVGGGSTHHIIVRDCDFAYIGGGDQRGGDHTVRYGNGVEFWGTAHDNLVERCRLWEVYDAALTNQSGGPNTPQYNIRYVNNVIWNCEYSFEYWNRPERSETHHIYFENNTCVNAGHGWGHAQRPDPSGRHLCFYTSPARISDFYVRNNIFFEATRNAFYAPGWSKEAIDALVMDHNCWYQASGDMVLFKDHAYPMARFETYQSDWAKEPHSIVATPHFADAEEGDYRLAQESACIDAGADIGLGADFEGRPVPHGAAPDIGAYEYARE